MSLLSCLVGIQWLLPRVDLSVSSSLSFGVACFACSSCSSVCSLVVNLLRFFIVHEVRASCSFGIKCFSRIRMLFHHVLHGLCLRVERGLQVGSHFFQVFDHCCVYFPCLLCGSWFGVVDLFCPNVWRTCCVVGGSCSLLYLLSELTYCCWKAGVDRNRVRGSCRDEDVAVVVCCVLLETVDVGGGWRLWMCENSKIFVSSESSVRSFFVERCRSPFSISKTNAPCEYPVDGPFRDCLSRIAVVKVLGITALGRRAPWLSLTSSLLRSKSVSFTCPSLSRRMFSGLSRYTMFRWPRFLIAKRISRA